MKTQKQKTAGIPKSKDTLKTFAFRLNDLMNAGGFTQASLAQKVGISQQTIQAYIAAETSPKIENLVAIANALGVSCDYLAGVSRAAARDESIQAVVKKYGLSEEALLTLENIQETVGNDHVDFRTGILNLLLDPQVAGIGGNILTAIGDIVLDDVQIVNYYFASISEKKKDEYIPVEKELQRTFFVLTLNNLLERLRAAIVDTQKTKSTGDGLPSHIVDATKELTAWKGRLAKRARKTTTKKKGA